MLWRQGYHNRTDLFSHDCKDASSAMSAFFIHFEQIGEDEGSSAVRTGVVYGHISAPVFRAIELTPDSKCFQQEA